MRKILGDKSRRERSRSEQGFMLVGLIVAIFLILLALSVAAPKVAQELRRDERWRRCTGGTSMCGRSGCTTARLIRYPGSIEQLEKTNNIRFLRQQYVDPMTGKEDWRLIHVGEAKTTVKGFFGQPLAGLTPGLGSAAGMASGAGWCGGSAGRECVWGVSGSRRLGLRRRVGWDGRRDADAGMGVRRWMGGLPTLGGEWRVEWVWIG